MRLRLAALWLAGFAFAAPAFAQTDPSFELTATAKNFDSHFPGYLANGYFSTMTTPRGTEPAMGYMVAFMDYAKGDISRPAAIPGWSEFDYNPSGGWLNATRLDPTIFADYAQTLNMHDGTLTTRYRFDFAGKSTAVQVTTLVSQADPHLAASQLSITPQFDGKVQLTFPIRLWSEHQPRFPIGSMSGEAMIDAVIASGQNLQNKPVPTPDRAAVWYPGHTRILASGGDAKQLTFRSLTPPLSAPVHPGAVECCAAWPRDRQVRGSTRSADRLAMFRQPRTRPLPARYFPRSSG